MQSIIEYLSKKTVYYSGFNEQVTKGVLEFEQDIMDNEGSY